MELKHDDTYSLVRGNEILFRIQPAPGCTDKLAEVESGVWLWTRTSETAVDRMRMCLETPTASFTMIPAVSYNGNGWGDSEEYVGDRDGDLPWTFAWHRCAIPACTYSERGDVSVALFARDDDTASCSLYREGDKTCHVLLWPEEEAPRVLMRHYWESAYHGAIQPRSVFTALICVSENIQPKKGYRKLIDYAWRRFSHPLSPRFSTGELARMTLEFFKSLYTREDDGFCAFNRGLGWNKESGSFEKRKRICYEIGWVGQNASLANALLWDYLKSGDESERDMALSVLDSWVRDAFLPGGLMRVKFFKSPTADENILVEEQNWGYMPEVENRVGPVRFLIDACNLGGAAAGFFEAAQLCGKAGIKRPAYEGCALGICDFALGAQAADGSFAKSWNSKGEATRKGGTVGCFLIPPLVTAFKISGKEAYRDAAVRAFDHYIADFQRDGFTTAGALDTCCIDKESVSPLLESALVLYRLTGEKRYLDAAVDAAWYLMSWMELFTVRYPAHTVCGQIGFDTLGMTAVSTAHNAVDHYAIRDVPALLELASLTGDERWKTWAGAIWCAATQLVSDGTLTIAGRTRPVGSEDEAVYHTRWARKDFDTCRPTEWLTAFHAAFRMEAIRRLPDPAVLDETV